MAGRLRRFLRLRALVLVVAAILSPSPGADSGVIAILYPDIGRDYDAVFASISDGVSQTVGAPLLHLPLPDQFPQTHVSDRLRGIQVKGVAALGRRGLQAVQGAEWRGPLVASAVIWDSSLADKNVPAITFDPDPRLLLGYLKLFAPPVRRVYLVIDQGRNKWLAGRARTAASENGFSLVVREVTNRREAALAYRDILSCVHGPADAVWLPLDPDTVDETTPQLVLRAAWDKRFVAFSSAADHAQRGALFSVIPDYVGLGRQLGRMLQAQVRGEAAGGVQPNTQLRVAVNMRTARHLGLEYSRESEARIGVVFR
jgi:putative ABC transport system substrate-binding protein